MAKLDVKEIVLREIRMPLREAFATSSGREEARRILLLQLIDAQGRESWSECVAMTRPDYWPETVDTAWLALRAWIAPLVLHRTFAAPQEVHLFLQAVIRGHNMAKAAVEMATWDLTAQQQQVSLARLLGAVREKVATGVAMGIQPDTTTLVQKVREARDLGYRRIKLKVKPGTDIEAVAAVREALGPDTPLSVDANCAYTLADTEHLTKLDAFDLLMLEQPLAWNDLTRHAELQKALKTPICLDESISGVSEVEAMVTLQSARIVNIKPGRVGGLTPSLAIHDTCLAHAIPVWCGGMLETGIGRAYNVALASLPNFKLPGDLSPSARYWERDIVSPEWTMTDGLVTVPLDRPGLGVTVDRDRIDDLTVRVERVGA